MWSSVARLRLIWFYKCNNLQFFRRTLGDNITSIYIGYDTHEITSYGVWFVLAGKRRFCKQRNVITTRHSYKTLWRFISTTEVALTKTNEWQQWRTSARWCSFCSACGSLSPGEGKLCSRGGFRLRGGTLPRKWGEFGNCWRTTRFRDLDGDARWLDWEQFGFKILSITNN